MDAGRQRERLILCFLKRQYVYLVPVEAHNGSFVCALAVVGRRENRQHYWFLARAPSMKLEALLLELVGTYQRL